tara:strand:+ start:242 stop:685 length:444 start_codon:yes stop_codon:yes gene_type:complete
MHIATKSSKIDISSEKKLEEFAKKIAQNTKKGDIFFLYGEMGVGKTTFVKHVINKIQFTLKEKITEVTSPTFSIMNEYILGNLVVKHYDLYRLKSVKELKDLNLFGNDEEILFIEWPELIKQELNLITKLYFQYENNYKDRSIKILN